jgi:toxin YoeB
MANYFPLINRTSHSFCTRRMGGLLYWHAQDKRALKRLNSLITATARDPVTGISKPEPLRGDLSGYWSRRIDEMHRLSYRVTDADLVIIAGRFHYDGTVLEAWH